MDAPSGRRRFLKSVIAMGAVGLPTADVSAAPHRPAAPSPEPAADRAPATHPRVYTFLMAPEVAFVEAAIARLIPADELGPGAREAGVAFFIDQQLGGAWGTMARSYRLGPWPEGTPQQGYQSPLTPQEVYRAAIRDTDRYCQKQYDKTFAALPPGQQDEVLRGLEDDKIALDSVPARLFFTLLLGNTQEGFFADPIYGGNRDKVGWKLVGFPGVPAVYTDHIDKYNVPYRAEPVSIADVQQNLTELDEHGHARHVLLRPDE